MKANVIALALLLAGSGVASAQPTAVPVMEPGSTLLSITAEGQSLRAPDVAMFSAGVVTQAKTAGAAMAANATRMDAVIAALTRAGIADRDIQTASISVQPQYSNPDREEAMRARMAREPMTIPAEPRAPTIIGYEVRNSVRVRVRRLGEMGRIIDTLITAGANQVDGPSFTLDDPQCALNEARTQAVQRARARAELYARAAGLRVTRILSISEAGGYYPVQEIMVTGSIGRGAGAPPPPPPSPVSPGELTLGVSLSVQFALQR